MTDRQQPHPQQLFIGKSTPEQFIDAEIGDWIYLVGDITTFYEVDFIRRFGHALKEASHSSATERKVCCASCPCREPNCDDDCPEWLENNALLKVQINDAAQAARKDEREKVLDELTNYINEMYPVPGPEGDYLYPSRKGRREVYDQLRDLILSLRNGGK